MRLFRTSRRRDHHYRHVGMLRPPNGFDTLITVGIGPNGIPIALWAAESDQADLSSRHGHPGGVGFVPSRTSSKPHVALTRHERGREQPISTVAVDHLPVAHPFVQPLSNGDALIVEARCAWLNEGPEQNALVVAADGTIRRTGTVGDGIEHVLVDAEDHIWTGYFDEGVFGNLGWDGPGPKPLGSAGIIQWSPSFEPLWKYEAVDDYELADCYALNVAHDQVWACTYTDFPIIRIRDRTSAVFHTQGITGPGGLVVSGVVVGVIGDYTGGGALITASLDELPRIHRSSLAMPNGSKPPRGRLICRGSVANLFVDRDWFMFDLGEAL